MTKEEWIVICLSPIGRPEDMSGIWDAANSYGSILTKSHCFGCEACIPMEPYPCEDLPFGLYLWEYLTKLGF